MDIRNALEEASKAVDSNYGDEWMMYRQDCHIIDYNSNGATIDVSVYSLRHERIDSNYRVKMSWPCEWPIMMIKKQ